MSKTPRTDEHLRMKEENGHAVIVSDDFARQLETELADKDKLIENMQRRVRYYMKHNEKFGDEETEYFLGLRLTCENIIKLLSEAVEAAERGERL